MKANLGSAGTYGYPYNLVADVLGIQHMDEWKAHEPPDSLETIESVLSELDQREQRVLRYRYQDQLTYSDIAKHEERTVERMRQVVSKALRRLKHPLKRNRILYGNKLAVEKADEQRRREKIIFYAKIIADTLSAKSAQENYVKKMGEVNKYYRMNFAQQAKFIVDRDGLRVTNAVFPNMLGETLWINDIRYMWQLALYSELDLKVIAHLNPSDISIIKKKLTELGWGLAKDRFFNNVRLYTKLKEEFIRMELSEEE